MKKFLPLTLFGVFLFLLGCAKWSNEIARDGSIIGSTKGDFIVIKQSGGRITDVWKLRNVIVQSEEGSDGWLFCDNDGNPVNVGGDMKSIRLVGSRSQELWDKYYEYHAEFETLTYEEKFLKKVQQ